MKTTLRRSGKKASSSSRMSDRDAAYLRELKHEVIADFAATRARLRRVQAPEMILFLIIIGAAAVVPLIINLYVVHDIATGGVNTLADVCKLLASGALNAVTVVVVKLSKRLSEVVREFADRESRLTHEIGLIRSCSSAAAVYKVLAASGPDLVPGARAGRRARRPGSPPAGAGAS